MNKFPLLEGLRADREREEAEITAPVRGRLSACQSQAAQLVATIRTMRDTLAGKLSEVIIEDMGRHLTTELRRKTMEAVGKAEDDEIVIRLSRQSLFWSDPGSFERQIIEDYVRRSMPSLSVNAMVSPHDKVTILSVSIPELRLSRAIAA